MRLISAEAGGEVGGLLTKSVRAAELVVAGKGFKAESALVDQMEFPNGVVVDQGLLVFPRSDWGGKKREKRLCKCSPGRRRRRLRALTAVGAVEGPELLCQECRESLLETSQMEETEGISDQLC